MTRDLPPLSVLDVAPVSSDQNSSGALAASSQLARAADRLGYRRFWVAEHHNFPGVASTSPAVFIGHLGAVTERIHLGSGGVMLPNHPPLVVAEQFALLEALYPGRVDLGIGRAPGTDGMTAAMLRRAAHQGAVEDFVREISDVQALMGAGWGEQDLAVSAGDQRFAATPSPKGVPETWILGSSTSSAHVAAALGLPYAFANHFGRAAGSVDDAVAVYRDRFRPSETLDAPYVLVTAAAVVGDDAEHARALALPAALGWVDIVRGSRRAQRTLAEASVAVLDAQAQALVDDRIGATAVGTADEVAEHLAALAARTGADELMLAVQSPTVETRVAALEALAPTFAAMTR